MPTQNNQLAKMLSQNVHSQAQNVTCAPNKNVRFLSIRTIIKLYSLTNYILSTCYANRRNVQWKLIELILCYQVFLLVSTSNHLLWFFEWIDEFYLFVASYAKNFLFRKIQLSRNIGAIFKWTNTRKRIQPIFDNYHF